MESCTCVAVFAPAAEAQWKAGIMGKHVRIAAIAAASAALLAVPALVGAASANAAGGPPKCEGGGFLDAITPTGPGAARVDATFHHCPVTLDSVVAFGAPGTTPVVLLTATPGGRVYSVSAEVTLPAGTTRVCGVAYADWADLCIAVTVGANPDGTLATPAVGNLVTMYNTATGTTPLHPNVVPQGPDPTCPNCW
jgi:hypothetical protein